MIFDIGNEKFEVLKEELTKFKSSEMTFCAVW